MAIPYTNASFTSINTELYRTPNVQYTLDDFEGRKLASAGNTGQNLASRTEVRLSNFLGHARRKVDIDNGQFVKNLNLFTSISATNYVSSKTYATLTNNGVIGSATQVSGATVVLPGLSVPATFANGDIIEIINNNYIVGAGGIGGQGAMYDYGLSGYPGGAGSDAMNIAFRTEIYNNGTIGGGGGGGGGGAGGYGNEIPYVGRPLFFGGHGGGGAGDVNSTRSPGTFTGGAFSYIYSNNTVDSDPGVGYLKFNNVSLSAVTQMYINKTDRYQANIIAVTSSIDSSMTSPKGYITAGDELNPDQTKVQFSITGASTDAGTYFKFPVTFVTGNAAISTATLNMVAILAKTESITNIGTSPGAPTIETGGVGGTGTSVPPGFGAGSPGGAGGNLGQPGLPGGPGFFAITAQGGAPGRYVVGNVNVIWETPGRRLGPVA